MTRPRSATRDDKDKPAEPPSAPAVDPQANPSPPQKLPSVLTSDKEHPHEAHFDLPLAGNVIGASTAAGAHPLIAAFSSMMRPIVDKTHPSKESFHMCLRLFNQTNFNLVLGEAFHCGGEFYQGTPKLGHIVGPGESCGFEVRAKSYPFWSGGCQGGLQLALTDGEEHLTGFAMGWSAPPIGSYQASFSAHHDAKAGRRAARAWGHDESNVTILTAQHHGLLNVFHLVATPGQNAAYQVVQMPPLGVVHVSAGSEKVRSTGGALEEGAAHFKEEVKGLGERLGQTMGGVKGGKEGVKATGSSEAPDEQKHTHRPESQDSDSRKSQTQPAQQRMAVPIPQGKQLGLPQERLQLHQSAEDLRQDPSAEKHEAMSAHRTSLDQTRDKLRRVRRGDKPTPATASA